MDGGGRIASGTAIESNAGRGCREHGVLYCINSVSFVFSVVNNPFSLIWIILSQFLTNFGYQRRLSMTCRNSASFLTSALPNRGLV
jgi:hypothetical protein